MKKLATFYGDINEESGVIMAFTKIHEALGFERLIPSSARGFDIDKILYNGQYVTVEFEYKSENFIKHGHVDKMEKGKKYVVVCWYDNCKLREKVKEIYDVIELRNFISIKHDLGEDIKEREIKYMILSYNPNYADGKDFSSWKYSNMYRTRSKFKGNEIPSGSKILFSENGYIVGGCTIVRYEYIEKPKNDVEWELYRKLTNYPVSLYTRTIEESKEQFINGHIFYTDFFEIDNIKIEWRKFIDKNMSHDGRIYISKEEYYRIIGN